MINMYITYRGFVCIGKIEIEKNFKKFFCDIIYGKRVNLKDVAILHQSEIFNKNKKEVLEIYSKSKKLPNLKISAKYIITSSEDLEDKIKKSTLTVVNKENKQY